MNKTGCARISSGLVLRYDDRHVTKGGKTISYINAQDVLPAELISEIRKYIEGEAIYIPRAVGRAKWGGQTGARAELDRRNSEIRSDYENGVTVPQLSIKYCLCCDSIRKILRKAD